MPTKDERELPAPASSAAALDAQAVREQLVRTLESPGFQRSAGLSNLLRTLVEKKLACEEQDLKEYHLGVEVFARGKDFDPRIDPIVRVQARNLRLKLDEYYAGPGAAGPIRIEVPKGSYVPIFRLNRPAGFDVLAMDEALRPLPGRGILRPWAIWAVTLVAVSLAAVIAYRFGVLAGIERAQNMTMVMVAPFETLAVGPEAPTLAGMMTVSIKQALIHDPALILANAAPKRGYRLSGVVARRGDRVVVKAQLFRRAQRIWSGTYECLASNDHDVVRIVTGELTPTVRTLLARYRSLD